MENVKKHIKFVTTEERNNYLISESKYHATNFFSENVNENEKKDPDYS